MTELIFSLNLSEPHCFRSGFCDGSQSPLTLYIHIIPTKLCTLNTITGISAGIVS